MMISRRPRVFYFCHSHNHPTGGQKHTYRHVDILNAHGIEAYAFHLTEGFRLEWFDNHTQTLGPAGFKAHFDPAHDYVVLPEDLGERINKFSGRKIIFNKNFFYGFHALGKAAPVPYYPYLAPDVVAAFVVSEHNRAHLQFTYPRLRIYKLQPEIRPDIFAYRPLDQKKAAVACIPKSPLISLSLFHMLESRAAAGLNRGRDFTWTFLGEQSEAETARILQDSLLFVFINVTEGLARMPLEAMSCGCILAAYRYGPLMETIPDSLNFSFGDLVPLAQYVEDVMESFPRDLERWRTTVSTGRHIAAQYSPEAQERKVVSAWEEIMSA